MTDLGFNNLPRRAHRRPQTSDRVPHIQRDQIPSGDIVQRLLLRISQLSNVRERDSRMAMPGVKAFIGHPPDGAEGTTRPVDRSLLGLAKARITTGRNRSGSGDLDPSASLLSFATGDDLNDANDR